MLLFVKIYVVTTNLLFYTYFTPFSLALLTRINNLLSPLCPKESLLSSKWKPTKEANKPTVSIASRMS